MNPRIVRNIERPDPDVVRLLGELGVATVHEAQRRTGLMRPYMRPLYLSARLAGPAVTVSCHPGDNLMIHAAVEVCKPGDVLVVAPISESSDGMFGELLGESCRAHGIAGVVVDAGIRDSAELTAMNFPIWSKAISAQGTVKSSAGSVNVDIVCAGATVHPGDVIVGDADGVAVVHRRIAAEVARLGDERRAKEEKLRERLRSGELGLDMYGLRAKLIGVGNRVRGTRRSREIKFMGQLVAALATCHAPQLFTRPPSDDPAQLDATAAAMRELGKALDESKPDLLVIFGSDHLETFFLSAVPTFALIAGESANASFAGQTYNLPIHQAFGEDLLERLVAGGFDMVYSQDAILGHAFAAVFEWVMEGRKIPVVPIFINTYLPPLPSARRCEALGRAVREVIDSRPERVAVLASGGLSHFPGTWKYSQPEFEFDHWAIAHMERGNMEPLLRLSVQQLDEVGNTELLSWMALFGVMGNAPGELLSYQPTWHHGHAVMRFLPRRKDASMPKGAPPSETFEFKNQGYEFYKHPTPSSYKLNKLLFDLRHKPRLRLERFERQRCRRLRVWFKCGGDEGAAHTDR